MMNSPIARLPREAVRAAVAGFELENQGFSLLREAVPPDIVRSIDSELDATFRATPFGVGRFYGERTKRFGRLARRSQSVADQLIMNPAILQLVERVLRPWCDVIQLNVAQAIEVHPGALAQFPHRDQDMWRGFTGRTELLVNVIWPLGQFDEENGATRLWPGSHGSSALEPQDATAGVCAQAAPGDALLFLGSTLHGAGANRTALPRRAIVIGYSLGWLKPYENPFLAYPPAIARTFSPELAALVGYRQHRPNLGNFEGQCPSILLDGDGEGMHAATDALLPEQVDALEEHARLQKAGLLAD